MGKIDKRTLLQSLKADLKSAEDLKNDNDSKIEQRRHTYNGDKYGNEEKDKSSIVPKVAKRQSEWAHASLKDPFVSTPRIIKCTPITVEDVEPARQNETLLNYQFCRQFDRYNFITKALKVLDVDATLFVQVGWDYEDKKVTKEVEVVKQNEYGEEFITTEIVEETVVIKNQPTATVCRSEDVFVDPTCQDNLDNAQFVIYRYETDLSTLRADGRYKNLKLVAKNMMDAADDADYEEEDKTKFRFQDDPRKKIVVYEYWGNYDVNGDGIVEQIVCAWVDDIVIRLEDNPYPDKKAPFLVVPFSSIPFQIHGENNLDLIADQQQVITAVTRGIINNMAASTNGQTGIMKGALDSTQKKKFLAGKNFEYNMTQPGIWQGSYNQIPGSAFNMIEMMNNEVESLTGIKSFSRGISGNSLGSGSATATRGVLDATTVRRMDIVRNIAENLIKPLMRKWMAYNSEFLSNEEVIRVTNEQFVTIRRDDLEGRIDIDIEVRTAEDNHSKAQELSFLLQTMGPKGDPKLVTMLMKKMAKLNRMPDLEAELENFKPEPDPLEQQIKQLQVEKLQAEIEAIKSASHEDDADRAEKMAQARYKDAQTQKLLADKEKILSEKDKLDLEFVKTDEEVDTKRKQEEMVLKHQMELEKAEQAAKANMESMAFQKLADDKNIGVMR